MYPSILLCIFKLEKSAELPHDDKQELLQMLNRAIKSAKKRLELSTAEESRVEPEGGRSDSPNSVHNARYPIQQQLSSATTMTSSPGGTNLITIDQNFLATHGPALLTALLQQNNMAKQN